MAGDVNKSTKKGKQNVSSTESRKRKPSLWLHQPKAKHRRPEKTCTPQSSSSSSQRPGSAELLQAPLKKSVRKTLKGKRKLFSDSLSEKIAEINELVPLLLKKLQVAGILIEFCQFVRLLCAGKFPLNNIALLLLLDVVRWYSLESTTQMTYKDETLKFWKVLYRLFHDKALRFLSGLKSSGHVVEDKCARGSYDPQGTRINFAVPSRAVIAQHKPAEVNVPDEVPPGIIHDAINMRDKSKTYVLSMDGKKLAPGLSRDKGDINLFGFEQSDSLETTKNRLSDELKVVENANLQWSSLSTDGNITILSDLILIISKRIQDLRCLHVKQSLALKKFEKEAGSDWRNSRFMYAISSIQAFIHQLRGLVQRLLDINNTLLEIGSSVCETHADFSISGTVDAFAHKNWISLKEPNGLPGDCKDNSAYTKQRTPEWFAIRSTFPVTGSRLFEGIGLDTLKKQQSHIQKILHPDQPDEPFSEEVAANMAHGVESEINAVATLVGKVLPFYFPQSKYIEEGAHVITTDGKPLILVSPDGSIGQLDISDNETTPKRNIACEFKCPVPAIYKPPVHYGIPKRYITQLLGEMASMGVPELIYLSWAKESSTVFRVTFDEDLWALMKLEAEQLFMGDSIKKPTKISDQAKAIKSKLDVFADTNVKFLCEVPSLFGSNRGVSQTNDVSPYIFPVPTMCPNTKVFESVENVTTAASSALQDVFQLCRKKATEVVVWLLSDTDRDWNPEVPHSVPVAYAMKGYSLMSDTMRQMHDHVMQSCADKDVDISCSCFDGQWLRLATRDRNNKPLTVLQLQRDVWESASKRKRNEIVHHLTEADIGSDIKIAKSTGATLLVSSKTLSDMMMSYTNTVRERKCIAPREGLVEQNENTDEREGTLECLPEDALETILQEESLINDFLQPQPLAIAEETNAETGEILNETGEIICFEGGTLVETGEKHTPNGTVETHLIVETEETRVLEDTLELIETGEAHLLVEKEQSHSLVKKRETQVQAETGETHILVEAENSLIQASRTEDSTAGIIGDTTGQKYTGISDSQVEDAVLVRILGSLQNHPKVSVSRKWKEKSLSVLKKTLCDSATLHKLTHDEMNIMISETTEFQKTTGLIIRKSWRHCDKANALCRLIGSGVELHAEKYVKKLYTLKECASKIVSVNNSKIKKNVLNSVYAAHTFKEKYDSWMRDNPVRGQSEVEDVGTMQWFSYPEYSEARDKVEPKCVDAHHLLVNVRVKVCKDGVKNIKKEAWHEVAQKDSSIISKSLVVDLVDRQSNAFALRTFSEKVEHEMRKLGYNDEADFCNIIRSWYEAEDEPGLSAMERVNRRLKLKSYLLKDVSFAVFPPHGMYIKGFPKVWFESILQRIDTTIQLYSIVKTGTYNQRSISSLVKETFFGEISDMEPTKLGCPKSVNIPRLMSAVTELMHYRCDPSERVFHMSTTIRSVYPKNPLSTPVDSKQMEVDEEPSELDISGTRETRNPTPLGVIHLRDHAFDRYKRKRRKRQSKRVDISKLHQVARGCLPVRQHHKCDESKILPTTRLGIDLKGNV